MVAMGSSLADRAWGRESAVYRVTGVVSVIGGWFITAGAAFILCFLVAMLMHVGGFVAACIMMALAIFLLIRSNIRYKKKAEEENGDVTFNQMMLSTDKSEILTLLSKHIADSQSYFLEYVNAVKEAGNVWGIPVVDLNSLCGINPMIEEQVLYFGNSETDRLHPNAKGHERLARTLMYQLLTLPCRF